MASDTDNLKRLFRSVGKIVRIFVAKRLHRPQKSKSSYAPVKDASSKSKKKLPDEDSRGEDDNISDSYYGFVMFLLAKDARQCITTLNNFEVDGLPLKLELRPDKAAPQETKMQALAERIYTKDDNVAKFAVEKTIKTKGLQLSQIQILNIPPGINESTIIKSLRQLRPSALPKGIAMKTSTSNVEGGELKSYCIVEYENAEIATAVAHSLNGLEIPLCGRPKPLELLVSCGATSSDSCEGGVIIVRNLHFKVTEDKLRETFAPYGGISSVRLPTLQSPSGIRSRGFGFVAFINRKDAMKAIDVLNGKKQIFKRIIQVAWAVESHVYKELQAKKLLDDERVAQPLKGDSKSVHLRKPRTKAIALTGYLWNIALRNYKGSKNETVPSVGGVDDSSKTNETEAMNCKQAAIQANIIEGGKDDMVKFAKSDGFIYHTKLKEDGSSIAASSDNECDSVVDSEDDCATTRNSTCENTNEPIAKSNQCDNIIRSDNISNTKGKKSSDVDEQKTIHLRNLPYDVEESELKDVFASKYGDVVSCILMKDSRSGRCQGTGFIKFAKQSAAQAAVRDEGLTNAKLASLPVPKTYGKRQKPGTLAQNTPLTTASLLPIEGYGISFRGRRVLVSMALTSSQANEASAFRKKASEELTAQQKYLHLLDVGRVTKKDIEWKELSNAERLRHEAAWKEDCSRVNSPTANHCFFVNPKRLCIRNLPTRVDDEELRRTTEKLMIQSVEGKTALKKIEELRTAPLIKKQDNATAFTAGKPVGRRRQLPTDLRSLSRAAIQKVNVIWVKKTETDTQSGNESTTKGKSRGFAFIDLKTHNSAVSLLNLLRHNPCFGTNRRPIVSFAVEDRRALAIQKKRRLDASERNKRDDTVRRGKQTSRGRRQREARRRDKAITGKEVK